MPINSACTPMCGIRANAEDTIRREAHYRCPQDITCRGDGRCGEPACTCPADGPGTSRVTSPGSEAIAPRGLDGKLLHGTPMCARWYERAGDYRPWHYIRPTLTTPVPDVNPWAPQPLTTARREPGGQDVPGGEGAIFGDQRAPADLQAARDDLIRRLAPPGDAP